MLALKQRYHFLRIPPAFGKHSMYGGRASSAELVVFFRWHICEWTVYSVHTPMMNRMTNVGSALSLVSREACKDKGSESPNAYSHCPGNGI